MQQANPYQKYKQQTVMTMTQGEMITLLYDGIIKNCNAALIALEEREYVLVNEKLQKAQKIVMHLRTTLNFQYEISSGLDSMYEYFYHMLIQANIKKAAEPIMEILPMVEELRDAFTSADKAVRAN